MKYIDDEFQKILGNVHPNHKVYKEKPAHMPKSIENWFQNIYTDVPTANQESKETFIPSTLALHHLIPKKIIQEQLSKEISNYSLQELQRTATILGLNGTLFEDKANQVQDFIQSIVWAPMFLVLGPKSDVRDNDPKDKFDEELVTPAES